MAQAKTDSTPREWTLDDYYRLIRLTLRCGISAALREMERRVVMRESQLMEYGADDKANPVDALDFLRNYTFQVDRGERVRVVTREPAGGLLPGRRTTSITKFDEFDRIVQIEHGYVTGGFYTIVEQATSPALTAAPPPSTRQSIKETRVLEVLRKLDSECRVRDDMQPAEVEKIVKPHYPHDEKVSRRTIYRAYKIFLKTPPAK